MSTNLNGPETSVFQKVLCWLRAGYPEGIPPKDYFPLLALLRRTLDETELDAVIASLIADRPEAVSREDIEAAISRLTSVEPQPEELHMVASRLAAGGWPLIGFGGRDPAR